MLGSYLTGSYCHLLSRPHAIFVYIFCLVQSERLRLEAEIKAAEAAARKKAEAERRVQRDKEREAARIALEEVIY